MSDCTPALAGASSDAPARSNPWERATAGPCRDLRFANFTGSAYSLVIPAPPARRPRSVRYDTVVLMHHSLYIYIVDASFS